MAEIDLRDKWYACPNCSRKFSDYEMLLGHQCQKTIGGTHEKNLVGPQEQDAHYKRLKLEPLDIAKANDLDGFETKLVKYILRYPFKGKVKDLYKAKHILEMLIKHVEDGYMPLRGRNG